MINRENPPTIPNGSLVWKMGQMWGILPPNEDGNYSKKNAIFSSIKPSGIEDIYFGKGSFKRSLQIIGTPPLSNLQTIIEMGWVSVHLSIVNGEINIECKGGSEAATKRWAMPDSHIKKPPKRKFTHFMPYNNPIQLYPSQHERQLHANISMELLRSEIYVRDKGICWACNEFVLLRDYEIGHLVERSNGGHDSFDNCAVMHRSCNRSKPRHHTIEEASQWRLTRHLS